MGVCGLRIGRTRAGCSNPQSAIPNPQFYDDRPHHLRRHLSPHRRPAASLRPPQSPRREPARRRRDGGVRRAVAPRCLRGHRPRRARVSPRADADRRLSRGREILRMGRRVGAAPCPHARAPAARRRRGGRPPVRAVRQRHRLPRRHAGAARRARAAARAAEPQNLLGGIWTGASFGGFLLRMLPAGLGGLAITYGCLRWAYRDELREPFRERLETVPVTLDRPLVVKGLALFGVAVIAWLAGGSLPLVAITAGAAMVAVAQRDPAYAINRVEWSLLLFFGSLFVVMRGFERAVADPWIHTHGLGVAWGSDWSLATTLTAVMVVLSNLVSNVPAVMLWRGVIPNLPRAELVWRLVAMSSTFAGNLLLIGSMANLIVAEKAESRGVRIGFGEYARVGVPVTLLTLAWGIAAIGLSAG